MFMLTMAIFFFFFCPVAVHMHRFLFVFILVVNVTQQPITSENQAAAVVYCDCELVHVSSAVTEE